MRHFEGDLGMEGWGIGDWVRGFAKKQKNLAKMKEK